MVATPVVYEDVFFQGPLVTTVTNRNINAGKPNTDIFKDFLKQEFSGQLFIAHCEETDKQQLKKLLLPETNATLLIGPEGDFSAKEIQLALDSKFIPVSLGKTRLRTETAAIVACHSVAFVNEN
jgi:16S rRNA (uracil1498-N3)-methyltransferase